jgi:hypothetical protein
MGRRHYCPRPPRYTMARVIVYTVTLFDFGFRCWLVELLSPRPWPPSEGADWSLEAPNRGHLCASTMPKHKRRLRGKPRRGSPWRPRRPSLSLRDESIPASSRPSPEAELSHHSSDSVNCKLQSYGPDFTVALLFAALPSGSSRNSTGFLSVLGPPSHLRCSATTSEAGFCGRWNTLYGRSNE